MFGIKTKAKTNTSYPETFYLDFEYITMAMDYETRNFLERLSCNIPYKGRYIDSYGVKVELEQFQGIKLSSNYFRTEPNPWPNIKKALLSHSQEWVFFLQKKRE